MNIYRWFLIVFIWYTLFFPAFKAIYHEFWYDVMFYTMLYFEVPRLLKLVMLQSQVFILISFHVFWLIVFVDYLIKDNIGLKKIKNDSFGQSSLVVGCLLLPGFISIKPLQIDFKIFVLILMFVVVVTVFLASKTKRLLVNGKRS